jgi:hypothetical protein
LLSALRLKTRFSVHHLPFIIGGFKFEVQLSYVIRSHRDAHVTSRIRTGSGPGSPAGQPGWGGGSDRLGTQP